MSWMSQQENNLFEFGNFRLESAQRLLHRGDQVIALAPKAFDTLLALVENHGRVLEKDELLKKIWPETFVEEGSLTQNISILRKALGESSDGEKYIQTIPKRGYRFIAPVRTIAGSAVTLGDLRGAAPIEVQVEAARRPSSRRIFWTGGIGLCLAAVLAIFWWERARQAGSRPVDSVVVLPFLDLSDGGANQYLSDGMVEELINGLAQVKGLRVVARTTAFQFKSKAIDVREIGMQLSVDAVLEGSVRRHGDRLRITAQLNNAATGYHYWSRTWDRDAKDIFAVQQEIANDVVEALRGTNGDSAAVSLLQPAISPAAHDSYLLGRYEAAKRTDAGFRKSIEYYREAIARAPVYALAYAGLADSYGLLANYGIMRPSDVFPQAKAAAQKALEINSGLAQAHTSLAYAAATYDWDWDAAAREFHRAVELDPNDATARHWYGMFLISRGRFDEARRQSGRARELDPLSPVINWFVGWPEYYSREYDKAVAAFQRTLSLFPDFPVTHEMIGRTLLMKNLPAKAVSELARPDAGRFARAYLGYAYAHLGQRDKASQILMDFERQSQTNYVDPILSAIIYCGLHDRAEAFRCMEEAVFERVFSVAFLNVDPVWDDIRTDPRFRALIAHLNRP